MSFLPSTFTIDHWYSVRPLKVILTRWSYISEVVYMYFLSLSNVIKYVMSLRSKVADADSALRRHVIGYKRPCSHAWGELYSLSVCLFIHSHAHKWRSSLGSLSWHSKVSNLCFRKTVYFYSFPAVSYKWFKLSLPEERIQKEPISGVFLWILITLES